MIKERKANTEQVFNIYLESQIGKKPRRPQTYDMRLQRGTPEDIEFCKNYDERIAEWEEKAAAFHKQNQQEESNDAEVKPIKRPAINLSNQDIIDDFLQLYKWKNKRDFCFTNPFSHSDEPKKLLYTLVHYFNRDNEFFESELLNKELSVPSFDKGLLIVGAYGNGKTSIMEALVECFNRHIEFVESLEPKPENYFEHKEKLSFNSCISSDIVNKYNVATDNEEIERLLNPLFSKKQLFIDDILREQIAKNYGLRNIFLDVLTHRADNKSRTHLTLNYRETVHGKNDINLTLLAFKEKYDGRVYDRLFGFYNILELKGKSFRR